MVDAGKNVNWSKIKAPETKIFESNTWMKGIKYEAIEIM